MQGDFKPGQALVESELASQLGVSRAPIREALQILNTEGVVKIVPYHGAIVRKLTKRDIEELYSLRTLLETFAVRQILDQKDPDTPAVLKQYYERMLNAAEQGDLKSLNEIDREFHDALIELSGNQLLVLLWNTVAMRVRQVMALLNMRNEDLKQVAYNHQPIVDAIAAWDEENAIALIEQHVAASGELIAEEWTEDEDDDE
jgi:DNA-binding GntR family transcriptional regulator